MNLKKNVVGYKKFGEVIEITDPCYNRAVTCRLNVENCKKGNYSCIAWIDPTEDRVASSGIYWNGTIEDTKCEYFGRIGVDAGLAGFFTNKPDYTNDEWHVFLDKVFARNTNAWIFDEGFFTQSGFGDGVYPVYVYKNKNNEVVAIEIHFYEYDEEVEEEEE